MPNIKSKAKRMRQNEKARVRNKAIRSEIKTAVKKVQAAVAAADAEAADEAVSHCYKLLDKAVAKGVIHRNQAANRKSGVAKLRNKLVA